MLLRGCLLRGGEKRQPMEGLCTKQVKTTKKEATSRTLTQKEGKLGKNQKTSNGIHEDFIYVNTQKTKEERDNSRGRPRTRIRMGGKEIQKEINSELRKGFTEKRRRSQTGASQREGETKNISITWVGGTTSGTSD